MYQLVFLVLLLQTLHVLSSNVTCVQLDYIFQNADCCQLQNEIPCLHSIPKLNFDTVVQAVDDKLNEINNVFSQYVPLVLNKQLSDFCDNDEVIIGGLNYDHYTGATWYDRPKLYCEGNANRLVIIPQYKISHCYFTVEDGDIRYTAKIPYNPSMTIASYHQGTQSKTVAGFCETNTNWVTTSLMSISDINTLVSEHNGIMYYTTLSTNHSMKLPCTSEEEKVLGNNINRRTEMPLCSNFLYLNQVDCEANSGVWNSQLPLQMHTQITTIDLHKETSLEHIYFTRSSASSYMRFCLVTEYTDPSAYITGQNYGFSGIDEAHKVDIERR